ncbi:cupin domain-containing protein [Flavobacterium sp. LT1R49]|uniref:cupin domain-containing protein n=1 Tax=Flavobacterium arabinosi TaxID=3398737 RepID=UPI003A83ABB1
MKLKNIAGIFLIGVFAFSCKAQNKVTLSTETESQKSIIFPKGEKITNSNFTGIAYLQMLMKSDSLNPTSVGNVTFEPGARTKWHIHPGGQILLATDGVGYYQEKGQPKKILRKGDVIKCPPNIQHWHGASVDTYFVQVAITNTQNGVPVWLEAVTDEEYKQVQTNK